MSEHLIRVEELNFVYPQCEKPALENINFTLSKGEFIAVLGHNGSGKSTLAKLLNGLYLPTDGKVLVEGKDTTNIEEIFTIRKSVAMVFQNPDNQMVAASVEDDIAFGLENISYKSEDMEKRINDSLSLVDMLEFKGRPPHRLSGGQKQRVAIAGVLAMEPDCIIFDESTAMLDPEGRKEVINTIIELHKKGMAIILITHFSEEAMLADRVLVMSNGKIVKEDKPHLLFQEVEELKSLSLDVPLPIKLANNLSQQGINIGCVNNSDELIEAICQYKLNL